MTNSANREFVTVRSLRALPIRELARPAWYLPYNTACTRIALAVRELAGRWRTGRGAQGVNLESDDNYGANGPWLQLPLIACRIGCNLEAFAVI